MPEMKSEMITLFVNDAEVTVESGKNLIDALEAVGIEVPHFCYHPALGADGNCRLCMVEVEGGRPPVVPACKTPAQEGMRIHIDNEKIRKAHRDVMELELINHPLDCPVCDQAGECDLQDYYMRHDGAPSRMRVEPLRKEKRVDFGCGVIHDRERCVLCARCVRFCRQITKTGELCIVNRSDEARVSFFPGRPLDNRYALNVVDLCPVGALTSADFRFSQRAWFLKRSKSICHGCAKGCNIFIDHNREKGKDDIIYRFRPRHNDQVNGYFICDAGRMTYKLENENRLTASFVAGEESSFESALSAAGDAVAKAANIVIALSCDATLEQICAAQVFVEKVEKIEKMDAKTSVQLFAPADLMIKPGDGDDLLIQDDKAANRKGLELLGVETSDDAFAAALAECDLLIDASCGSADILSQEKGVAMPMRLLLAAHSGAERDAEVALPMASYSEYAGTLVNCDGVLQQFAPAVIKNEPQKELVELLHLLGGLIANIAEARGLLAQTGPFQSVDFTAVPEAGLQLAQPNQNSGE